MTAGRRQHTPREADEAVVSVKDIPRASRFELRVNGVFAGYLTYRDARSSRAFEHTVIATEHQGMGLASLLIRSALDEARAAGRNVLPLCPFVRSFIQRHPAYVDLVGQPQRFGLTVHTPDSR
jgi:predicted GNAT family acetyltransferase